jgi:hypothetical protein
MDTTIQKEPTEDDRTEAMREIVRQSLIEIAQEVESRLKEAGLNVPIFLSVPEFGGKSIVTIASPVDPNDDDWRSVLAIVCEVAENRLDGVSLRGHELRSAMANAKMTVGALTVDQAIV